VDIEQDAAQLGFFGFGWRVVGRLRDGDAQLLRDQADGFREGYVFDFLDEAEDVAGEAASEAVIELARGVDGERCSFFAVEGAESGVVLRAGFLQLNVVADDANDVRLLLDRVCEIAGVRHKRVLKI
jgi:hypothetical protein